MAFHLEGHEIGLHSFNHTEVVDLPARRRLPRLELSRDAVARATGLDVRTYRPPYPSTPASLDGQSLAAVKEAAGRGCRVVLADLDSRDHPQPGNLTCPQRPASPRVTRGVIGRERRRGRNLLI